MTTNTLTLTQPQISNEIILLGNQPRQSFFPDFIAALASVDAHIATLPSTTETTEKHTYHHYNRIISQFIDWLGRQLPTEDVVLQYMAHLSAKGCSNTTINNYMAALKLFCRMLAKQPINPYTINGDDRFALMEMRDQIRNVSDMKGLKSARKSNQAGIDQHKRASTEEMTTILNNIPKTRLDGLRDHAIFVLAFNSAMRVAEISRISLDHFKRHSDHTVLIVDLRGKGNNYDPIPVPLYVFRCLEGYYNAYNDGLPKRDPRRLTPSSDLWRPLTRSGNYFKSPTDPLTRWAVARIIQRRSADAGYPMDAHDTRRSAIAYLRHIGMQHAEIQKVSRHQSLDMVGRYVGTETNYDLFNHFLRAGAVRLE